MSFAAYKLMADILLASDSSDAVFARAFLILEWSLMARADSISTMHMAHIEWRQDALIVFFAKSKGNQTGEYSEFPFHVYSNPENPSIFPVLALLATYIFQTRMFYDQNVHSFHVPISMHDSLESSTVQLRRMKMLLGL